MKTKFVLSALLGCSLLLFTRTAAAQGSNSVSKNIRYQATLALRPTTNAPSNARGSISLSARNLNDNLSGRFSFVQRGLPAGDYRIVGVKASDDSTVTLGTFTVDNANTRSRVRQNIPSDVDATDINRVIVETTVGAVPMLRGTLDDRSGRSS